MRTGLSWFRILADLVHFLCLGLRSRSSLAAENLFLRKQLAFYQERKVKPRRADNPTRLTLVLLSRWFNWRDALTVVRPKTLVAWHRKGFRLFWRWKSEAGRRPIPVELQHLIRKMARENPSWGEERIANELLLKLGLRVSPRTIRKYMPKSPPADGYTSGRPAVGDFSKESRSGDHRLRFLRRSDRHLPNPLRVRGDGACLASIDSPQRDRPSHRRLDSATAARNHSFRPRVSLHHPRPRRDLFRRIGRFADPARP